MDTKLTQKKGLYVICDTQFIHAGQLYEKVHAALLGAAAIVQVRHKASYQTPISQAELETIVRLCHNFMVPLLINDDVELALNIGADGVHLGQSDVDCATARHQLGPEAVIGITCHNSLELARTAVAQGADYVAFGRFFPSLTKPEAPPADITTLQQARNEFKLPIVAIGGITPQNGRTLLTAGADFLAVIHGVFAQVDCEKAAREYSALFTNQ